MTLDISETLKQELKSSKVTPVLVFRIDGYDKVFNNTLIKTYIKIGDPGLKIGEPLPPELTVWKIGGFKTVAEQSAYVNFNIGTTTTLTQKLDPSRGLGSSVSQMNITMIDPNGEITNFISPGKVLSEILGRRVSIELGLSTSSYPQDFNVIFRGNIQDVESGAGFVTFYLSNTEERKRQTIYAPVVSKLADRVHYRSNSYRSVFYSNQPGILDLITIELVPGGTLGSETVTITGVGGTTVHVAISDGNTTATQLKKAIEGNLAATQLITMEIDGDKEDPQLANTFTLGVSAFADLESSAGFLPPQDNGTLSTYAKIGDEVIGYSEILFNALQGPITRGEFNSVPVFAEIGADVKAFLRLKGNAIDIILKLLISTSKQYYIDALDIESIGTFLTDTIDNAVFFRDIDIEQEYGVTPGDLVTTTDSLIPANNVTNSIILSVGKVTNGSYIILSDTLTTEDPSPMKVSIQSQFNTLSIGVGLLPSEVDVKQHLFIRDTFLPSVVLDLVVPEIPNGKEFIEQQLYMPISCFSVPRKGRSSIVYQVPPLATQEVVTLNLSNVLNPEALRIRRSLAENFFNQIIFGYDYDPVAEDLLSTHTYTSQPSQDRIPVGFKPFEIDSQALRTENNAEQLMESTAFRLLRRYQYGAEYIKGVKTLFGPGYATEIGDPIIVDFSALKLSDSRTGTREGDLRIMEILNKTLDIRTGAISLDLVDTAFGVNSRLGLISPSTLTGVGSTTTKLIIQKSFGTKPFDRESSKWTNGSYVGQVVTVRNGDYTQSYDTVLRGFDNNTPQGMLIDAIAVAPGENWTIENPRYPDSTDPKLFAFWKLRHAYFSPQVAVTNGVSLGNTKFKVSPTDALKFFINGICKVHNYDYSDDGVERAVTDVNLGSNTITLDGDVGFPIDDTHLVDLIGFPDKGAAYRII